jgi:hypothetical protein
MATIIAAGKAAGKPLLVAGCVPQGDRKAAELKGLSLLGARPLLHCVILLVSTIHPCVFVTNGCCLVYTDPSWEVQWGILLSSAVQR